MRNGINFAGGATGGLRARVTFVDERVPRAIRRIAVSGGAIPQSYAHSSIACDFFDDCSVIVGVELQIARQ